MAAGIPCVTDLRHRFTTFTRTDKSFICFITEIKVTDEDKLAGNRNFRKHSRKSLMCVSSHLDAFIMGSGLLHLSRYCFLPWFPKLPLSSHEHGRLLRELWKAEEDDTKYQRILRNIRHRPGVVILKDHSITNMQVQVEKCKNLFIVCFQLWQCWYRHAVVFYLVHIVTLFFYSFLLRFLLLFPSPFFRYLLIFQCLGFSPFPRSFISYFHFHNFNPFSL